MKRHVFFRVIPILFVISLLFCSCSARSTATAEQFQSAAEDVEYTVEEQDAGGLVSIHMATKNDTSAMVFYVCNSEEESKSAFTSLKANLPEDVKPDEVDSSYYSKCTAENDESYYSIIRMGSTVLASAVELSEKDNVLSVVKALGY